MDLARYFSLEYSPISRQRQQVAFYLSFAVERDIRINEYAAAAVYQALVAFQIGRGSFKSVFLY